MAGLGAAAMIATSAGCDMLPFETEKGTETEFNLVETTPNDKYENVEGYVSDVANEVINDPTYLDGKQKFEEMFDFYLNNGSYSPDCYGTDDNATCYRYFNKLYPNASNKEILYNTRVFYEMYGTRENSLYVIFVSSPKLSDNVQMGTDEWIYPFEITMVYSLLEFPNLTVEEQRDLIKSNKDDDIYTHSKILHKILNSKEYKVLAENLHNLNYTLNRQLGLNIKGSSKYSIYNYNPLTNKKENYTITTNVDNPDLLTLYYAEADYTKYDKYQEEISPKVEGISEVVLNSNEELKNITKYDLLYYTHKINDNLFYPYDFMDIKTP